MGLDLATQGARAAYGAVGRRLSKTASELNVSDETQVTEFTIVIPS